MIMKNQAKTAPKPSRKPPQPSVPDATNSAKSTARMRTKRPTRQDGSDPRSIKRRTVLVETESSMATAETDKSVGKGVLGGTKPRSLSLAFVMDRPSRR
jgi:hypothetical protein